MSFVMARNLPLKIHISLLGLQESANHFRVGIGNQTQVFMFAKQGFYQKPKRDMAF